MITTDVLGVERVGNAVLTETSVMASVIDGPVKAIVPMAKLAEVEAKYNVEKARWYAIALLRQLGRAQAISARPEERERSWSQTHVKPVVEYDVDDLVNEGWIHFEISRKGEHKPRSTRWSVRKAYYDYMRKLDGKSKRRDTMRAYSQRKSKGTVKQAMQVFGEAITMPDTDVNETVKLRTQAQQTICEYLGMGYRQRDIAKLMNVSRRYVTYHISLLRAEFQRNEFEHTVARNGIPYNTILQRPVARSFNNHFRPYVRQLRQVDAIAVPSHRDTRSELPIVAMANAMHHSLPLENVPSSYAVACVMA